MCRHSPARPSWSAAPTPTVPYGETAWQYTASSTGSESLTNIRYTGQRSDEDSTGLMFYNARMYDPALGSFISADTLVPDSHNQTLTVGYSETTLLVVANTESQSRLASARRGEYNVSNVPENATAFNRYMYAMGNPIARTDPSGHNSCTSGPGCGGVVHNYSSHPVWVHGSMPVRDSNGNIEYEVDANGRTRPKYTYEWYELPPGASSDAYSLNSYGDKIYDADAVSPADPNVPMSGGATGSRSTHGPTEYYKLCNMCEVTVRDKKDAQGNVIGQSLMDRPKSWWPWDVAGSTLANTIGLAGQWYTCTSTKSAENPLQTKCHD